MLHLGQHTTGLSRIDMKKYTLIVLYILLFPTFGTTVYLLLKQQESVTVDARLKDAYSTFENCGSKGRYSCEIYRGRYYLTDYKFLVDKNISGFVYKDFVKYGPSNQKVEISRMTLEGQLSIWWNIYAMFSGILIFFGPLLCLPWLDDTKGGGYGGPVNPAFYFL